MLRDTKNESRHFPPYTALESLPCLLCLLKRHAPSTPSAPLLCQPSPCSLPKPPLLHFRSQNCPFQGFFGACMQSYGSKIAPRTQETCPPTPALLPHPYPVNPLEAISLTPLCCTSVPTLPISTLFWSLYAIIGVQNSYAHSRDMPPQHSSCTPHLSPLHPHSLHAPARGTVSPKIAHFKAFLELV